MPKKILKHHEIAAMKAPEKEVTFYDEQESGLMLRVTRKGTKSFSYRYKIKIGNETKKRRFTIGRFPAMSLKEARKKVRDLKVKVDNGIDPQDEKRKKRYKKKELTFEELADRFSKQYLPKLKQRTRDEYQRIIDVELLGKGRNNKKGKPHWRGLNVSEITSQHVRQILNYKAHTEDAFTMANRIRSTISKIFEYGLEHVGIKNDKNPVENTPVFDQGENVRKRTYIEDEIQELWEYWETKPEPIQSYYKFLLLTGQRRTETMKMKWEHIERDKPCNRIKIGKDGRPRKEAFLADIWTIPANMAKNGQEHEVPLSDMAKEILDKLKPITGKSDYVFQSPVVDAQPLDNVKGTTNRIQKDTSISDFRLHDLRRTVATKLEESMIDEIVIKKILNHKSEGVTGKHYTWYKYTDRKMKALQRWSWRVKNIVSGKEQEAKIYKISS